MIFVIRQAGAHPALRRAPKGVCGRWERTEAWQSAVLAETAVNPTSFGQDEEGELYLVDRSSGTLYQLLARPRP
jgi:hypothetical protein